MLCDKMLSCFRSELTCTIFQKKVDEFDEKLINKMAQTFDEFMESHYNQPFLSETECRNLLNVADKMTFHEVYEIGKK